MGFTATTGNVSQYNQVNNYSGITDADPHRLVQMLLEGVLGKVAVVKGLMKRGEISKKGEVIGNAISIVSGLRASLDIEAGGELAENLDNLYEYIERRLLQANLKNDTDILDEVTSLLREIKTGWDAIPMEYRNKSSETVAANAASK